MDHQEEHHLKHQKEREHKKAEEKRVEDIKQETGPTIHPLWFLVVGFVLIIIIIAGWTMLML